MFGYGCFCLFCSRIHKKRGDFSLNRIQTNNVMTSHAVFRKANHDVCFWVKFCLLIAGDSLN